MLTRDLSPVSTSPASRLRRAPRTSLLTLLSAALAGALRPPSASRLLGVAV